MAPLTFCVFSCRAPRECQQEWRRLLCAPAGDAAAAVAAAAASDPAAFSADIRDTPAVA